MGTSVYMRLLLTIALGGVLLCACTPVRLTEDPVIAQRLDALAADVIVDHPGEVLLGLSERVKQVLDARINPSWSRARRIEELSEFFFSESERNIQYDAWLTQSATDTYLSGRGNCLSMSALFVASARHLGLDAKFQTVDVRPTWAESDEVMIRYEHIVAVGNVPRGDYVVDFLPGVFEDRGQQQLITDEQALALYYSNLSVEAMISGDATQGIQKNLQAIKLWPQNSNIWSNLGSAYRRDEQFELAELVFKRALTLDRENYSALSNLTHLLIRQNRSEDVDQYLDTVSRHYRRNPYYHYHIAQMQISRGEPSSAAESLRRASAIRQDDPVLLDAIAAAFASIDEDDAAKQQAERAEELRRKQQAGQNQAKRSISPLPVYW